MPFERAVLFNRNREGKLEKFDIGGKEFAFLVTNKFEGRDGWTMVYRYLDSVSIAEPVEES